ncbi:MAG: aspartate kinase, partial [Bacteroidota bacterium]|nr:aspartate kinase [Bacteroidota bacterium]
DGITNDPGALVKATQALTDTNFRMLSFGGSPNNFSFLIPTENKEKALHALNDAFFAATESV